MIDNNKRAGLCCASGSDRSSSEDEKIRYREGREIWVCGKTEIAESNSATRMVGHDEGSKGEIKKEKIRMDGNRDERRRISERRQKTK